MVETAGSVLWVESVLSVILAETMTTMTRIGLWPMILRKKIVLKNSIKLSKSYGSVNKWENRCMPE